MTKHQQIINAYTDFITNEKNQWDESYKWEVVKYFQENYNENLSDDELKQVFLEVLKKQNNILHWTQADLIKKIIQNEKTLDNFIYIIKFIYDETKSLSERLLFFFDRMKSLKEKLNLTGIPDESVFAFLLTIRYPDKYYFYRHNFYKKFASFIDENIPTKDKYISYMELLDKFRNEYVLPNQKIQNLTQEILLNDNLSLCDKKTILTQNIIFIAFGNEKVYEWNLKESLKRMGADETVYFYNILDLINNNLGLKQDDKRLHFYSNSENNINFTLGQKYILFYKFGTDLRCGIALPRNEQVPPHFVCEYFEGENAPKSCRTTSFKEAIPYINQIIEVAKETLNKTKKSGYRNKTYPSFEKSVFNLEYRNQIFNQVFNQNYQPVISPKKYTPVMKKQMTNHPLNQILFGPPGTGKTYHTITKALSIIENKAESELLLENRKELKKRFDNLLIKDWDNPKGQIGFVTFHQSMSFEDFIEGIKPEIATDENDNESVVYKIKDGIFKMMAGIAAQNEDVNFKDVYNKFIEDFLESDEEFLELETPRGKKYSLSVNTNNNLKLFTTENKNPQGSLTKERLEAYYKGDKTVFDGWKGYAEGFLNYLKQNYGLSKSKTDNQNKNFVLIIDEINRGNVSGIFGELITLLEPDKRAGNKEELTAVLPYSKKTFSVPNNLYIIGTMNTADRSVEALDTALRRRFGFSDMYPRYDLAQTIENVNLNDVLKTINNRIEVLLDRDHQIGHSYFIDIRNKQDLVNVFKDKIIPLLQEYFYGDFGKIGLILGSKFVEETDYSNVKFPNDFDFNINRDKGYKIKNITTENIIEAVKSIINDES